MLFTFVHEHHQARSIAKPLICRCQTRLAWKIDSTPDNTTAFLSSGQPLPMDDAPVCRINLNGVSNARQSDRYTNQTLSDVWRERLNSALNPDIRSLIPGVACSVLGQELEQRVVKHPLINARELSLSYKLWQVGTIPDQRSQPVFLLV